VRSSLKADVRASVALSIHNLTMALAASEGVLHLKLVHEVRRGNTLKGFKDFDLEAKARIWL